MLRWKLLAVWLGHWSRVPQFLFSWPEFVPPPALPKLQLRTNASNAGLPSDFREVLQRRLGELERQLLRKVAELEDEKSLLHNETSAHRQKTESTLNALLQRVAELERGTCRPVPDVLSEGGLLFTTLGRPKDFHLWAAVKRW